MQEVAILRIGHRPERDQRVTTHVALTGRAFGAAGMYLAADDPGVKKSVDDVVARWGGTFFVENNVSWRGCIRRWQESGGTAIHLTMYGEPLPAVLPQLRSHEKLLLVVGAEKVPGELYGLADHNISVTSQPHSEIASVAVLLDNLFQGEEFGIAYPDAPMQIIPMNRGERRL
jgi:tRNA (cytidine56-2'-O)-methyltransferase